MATNNSVMSQINNKTARVNPNSLSLKQLIDAPTMQKKFNEVLRDKAQGFTASVLNLVNNDKLLKNAAPMTIINAAMVAATLDLPVDKNLGYAWIIPYKNEASFQLGYKGYIQLAQRTGLYKHITATVVYEGEITNWDRFEETYERGDRTGNDVIGYLGHFEMINGFTKTVFWTFDEMDAHRRKFSKMSSGVKPSGVWATNYDAMAIKTVIRNLLSKWGILSIEMQRAQTADNSVIKDVDDGGNVLKDVTPEDMTDDLEEPTGEVAEPKESEGTSDKPELDIDPAKLGF